MSPDTTQTPEFVVSRAAKELREALQQHAANSGTNAAIAPECAFEGWVASSLEQVYSARDAFTTSAQNALTTMLVSYTAGAGVLFWLITAEKEPAWGRLMLLCVIASFVTAVPWWLRRAWLAKNIASYDLYISACVHAAVVHEAMALPRSHPWIDYVWSCQGAKGVFKENREGLNPAFAADHGFTFVPDSAASVAPVDHYRKILPLWRARGPNLFHYYNTIFGRRTRDAAIAGVMVCLVLVMCKAISPALIWD